MIPIRLFLRHRLLAANIDLAMCNVSTGCQLIDSKELCYNILSDSDKV